MTPTLAIVTMLRMFVGLRFGAMPIWRTSAGPLNDGAGSCAGRTSS